MLRTFSVTNFKAFEKKVTIDFTATGNYSFNKEAIMDGLVKTAIMYGKNASGKSSLSLAIFDVVSNLTDNHVMSSEYDNFVNAFCKNELVSFEYSFLFGESLVQYNYKKSNRTTIISEELIINENRVIYYDKSKSSTEFTVLLAGTENLIKDLSNLNISALKWVKNNSILPKNAETDAFSSLFDFVNRMLLFWALDARGFVGFEQKPTENIVNRIVERNNFENLKKFFNAAGFEEKLKLVKTIGDYELYVDYEGTLLPFSNVASTGMKSLLLVYYWLENIGEAKSPSFIIIDEFDAFYHYELSRYIVEKLKSYNVQVLLTTHNTTLISNDILRPDCYFICKKNNIANMNNLTNKEIRFGNNIEKLYRGGTFGK